MSKRAIKRATPDVESLETRQVPSAGASHAPAAGHARPAAAPPAAASQTISASAIKPNFGYLAFRVTNPTFYNNKVRPIVGHVLVQTKQPVPGQHYNVLSVVMRNGTAQTFNASSNFQVSLFGEHQFVPILTGNETWAPGQWMIFYALSKKYYPLPNQVTDGFVFKLDGAPSVVIPGPSAIFLRLKYNPATINHVLDYIITQGPAVQGGYGYEFGLPITNLTAFVNSKTRRNDFAGYF